MWWHNECMSEPEIVALRSAVDVVDTRMDLLVTQRADAQVEVDRYAAEATRLAAENVALRARIAELEGEEPEPPTPTRPPMLVGATVDAKSGQTKAAAIAAFETDTGAKLGVRRSFTGTFPTSIKNHDANADVGVRASVLSIKGTPTAAKFDTFLKTFPVDGHTRWVVWQHEPENDGGTMTPAYFKQGCDLLAERIAATKRTDIVPTLVLMSWLERDTSTSTSSAQWFPSDPAAWCLALDPYDPNNNRSLQQQTEPTLKLWRQAGGKRWGIGETGTHRTGAAGVAWIREGLAWALRESAEFVCYFHSAVGAEGPWWLDDPAMREAWGDHSPTMAL